MQLLFIYKDSRVSELVERLQELSLVPIAAVDEFDLGVQYVFEKRPSLIFLQEEIEGVSCVAVAGHIKTLLRESAPQIFLLRNDPGRKMLAGRDYFDGIVDLTGFGDELLAEVRQQLDTVPGMIWRQELPGLAEGEVSTMLQNSDAAELDRVAEILRASAETPRLDPAFELGKDDVYVLQPDEPEQLPEPLSLAASVVPPPLLPVAPAVTVVTIPAPEPAESLAKALPTQAPQPTAEPVKPAVAPVKPMAEPVKPAAAPLVAPQPPQLDDRMADEFKHFDEVLLRRQQHRSRSWLQISGVVAVLFLVGVSFYWGGRISSRKVTPPPVAATIPAPSLPAVPPALARLSAATRLTAAIPLPATFEAAVVDREYGVRNPGWERRLAPTFELLLFREQGALRAIQVIARGASGLSDQLIKEAMQLAGGTAVDWRKEEVKGGLRVSLGVLPNRVEVLRYMRPGTKAPVALVVALP